jgi:MtN3 and saliva related transmembrane protein
LHLNYILVFATLAYKKGNPKMMKWYRKYMTAVGILGQLLFYSEFVTISKNQSAQNVSLFGFICSLIAVFSWLVYGLLIKDKVLITSNIVGAVGAILTVAAILIYQ